jgi:hypothetical protein
VVVSLRRGRKRTKLRLLHTAKVRRGTTIRLLGRVLAPAQRLEVEHQRGAGKRPGAAAPVVAARQVARPGAAAEAPAADPTAAVAEVPVAAPVPAAVITEGVPRYGAAEPQPKRELTTRERSHLSRSTMYSSSKY